MRFYQGVSREMNCDWLEAIVNAEILRPSVEDGLRMTNVACDTIA